MSSIDMFTCNIVALAAGDLVRWSPVGDKYLIATNNKIDIYSVKVSPLTLLSRCILCVYIGACQAHSALIKIGPVLTPSF